MAQNQKIVLVTGGNAGLGFAISRLLVADPSFHVLMGSRSLERGREAVEKIKSYSLPGSIEVLGLDVTKEEVIEQAAQQVQQKYGRLDALVNNAGVMIPSGSLAEGMIELFKANAVGPALMVQHFLPLLEVSKSPRIVDVTSGAGSMHFRMLFTAPHSSVGSIAYRTSKAAQNMVFGCHAYQLRDSHVKTFLYGPGPTQSRTNQNKDFKTAEEGMQPVFEILKGERDEDANKYLHYGMPDGIAPW